MGKIEEEIKKNLPKDRNCKKCPYRYKNTCDITEELLGSGEEYCS